ncbi:hypothetical protein HY837_03470 [archaeon]|nr:hypothetical protein [archaeon]
MLRNSLEGILKPFKVAPVGTTGIIAGLFFAYNGIDNCSLNNFWPRWLEFSFGVSLTGFGIMSYRTAYTSFFKGLKHIQRFQKIDKRYVKKLIKPETTFWEKNPCYAKGYEAAAEISGFKEEFDKTIYELNNSPLLF